MQLTIFDLITSENYYLSAFFGLFIFFGCSTFLLSYKNKSAKIFAFVILLGASYYIFDIFQYFGVYPQIDEDFKQLINTCLLFLIVQYLSEIIFVEKPFYKKITIVNYSIFVIVFVLNLLFLNNDESLETLRNIVSFSYLYPLLIIILSIFTFNLYKTYKIKVKFVELNYSIIILFGFLLLFVSGLIYPFNKFLTLIFQLLSSCLVTYGYSKLGINPPFFQRLGSDLIRKKIELNRFRLQNLSDIIPEIYFEIESSGSIKFYNEKFLTTFQYTDEEVVSLKIFQLIENEKINQFQIDIQKRIKNQLIGGTEYTFIKKDGTKFPALFYAKPFFRGKKPKCIICIIVDLSELKAIEQQLIKDEEILRYITENSSNLYFIHNSEGEFTYLSPQSKLILGYEPEELTSMKKKYTDLLSDNPLNYNAIKTTQNVILKKLDQISYDVEAITKQGNKIWLAITKSPLNIDGKIVGMVGSAADITEKKIMELKILESEKKYRTLFHNINDVVFIHDMEGWFLEVNEIAIKRYEYSLSELLEKNVKDLAVSKYNSLFDNRINELLIKGEIIFESEHITKFGRTIPVEVNARIITFENKPAILSIVRDITERKETEQKMLQFEKQQFQSQRLESIASLAAGIAHEFNNKLTILSGNIDYLEICPENEKKSIFEELRNEIIQTKNLTQQLITFSEGGAPIKESKDINKIVESTVKFILNGLKSQFKFHFEGSNIAMVDSDQFYQVLSNIITNADQSMKNGGLIDIFVKTIEIHEGDLLALQPGKYVKISIKDQGEGIKLENFDKVFNPYFTTKEYGTGLGLPTAYSIIKRHGGLITFESEENIGTTFHIFIPSN